MIIDDRDEKLQFDINNKSAKVSALLSEKIDKYEYLTSDQIIPRNQKRVREKTLFVNSPLGKAFEKQMKK